MSIRHEQLKQNVEVSRQRLDHARAKRLESVKLHKRHKALNVVFWTVAPFSALAIGFTFAWWVILIWAVAFGVVTRMAWKDLITARNEIHAWRETELQNLSEVTEDIQALVERETLQLMDPKAYALIEAPLERPKKPRETYEEREMRAALELKQELLKAQKEFRAKQSKNRKKYSNYYSDHQYFYWTETRDNGSMVYKRKKFMSAEGAKKFGDAIAGNVTGRTVPKTKGKGKDK